PSTCDAVKRGRQLIVRDWKAIQSRHWSAYVNDRLLNSLCCWSVADTTCRGSLCCGSNGLTRGWPSQVLKGTAGGRRRLGAATNEGPAAPREERHSASTLCRIKVRIDCGVSVTKEAMRPR